MQFRSLSYFWIALLSATTPAAAQFAEPILTRSALPNPAGVVSLKFDFVSALGDTKGASTQAIPEARLEVGLGRGFATVLQMPLLRVSESAGNSVLAGGQFSMALQYLLAGSPSARYAVSLWGRLEVPTGSSAIVGSAIQLMPALLAEWHAMPRLSLQSNIAWNTTVGATTGRFANFQHANAVVWSASRHLMPVSEFVGSTNTLNGNTQLLIQPEVIAATVQHLEFTTGLSVALLPSPHYTIRSQVAWFWGRRKSDSP